MKPDPLELHCPTCGAPPGQPCRSIRLKPCAPHKDRLPWGYSRDDEAPARGDLPGFGRDLFGAVVRTGPKPKQPALFDARHWFELGYMDKWAGKGRDYHAPDAYQTGFDLAGQDMTDDDRDSNCNPGRAYAQAAVVGIIARN